MKDYEWDKVQRVTIEGKSVERSTFDRIGFNEFRTEIIDHADGSSTLVKTRGGRPLIVGYTDPFGGNAQDQEVNRSYTVRVFPNTVWTGVIRKVKGLWAKFKQATLFGSYAVVPRWTSGQTYPDTLVLKDGVLHLNTVKTGHAKLGGETVLPVAIPAPTGYPSSAGSDDSDFHLFLLDATEAAHLSGRLKSSIPDVLYSTNALDATATAYSAAEWSAGVDYSYVATKVSYNKWYMSPASALAQRSVLLRISKVAPYITQEASISRNYAATAYVFPTGSLTDTVGTTWEHAVTPHDTGMFAQYGKVGTPTTFPSYGTLHFEGYYQGTPQQTVVSHDYTYNGSGGFTEDYTLGYYNGVEIPVTVAMTAVTQYLRRESTGSIHTANAHFIMPANQSSSPPTYSYQFLSLGDGSSGPGGGGWNPGDYVGPTIASSTSTTRSWTSTSTMSCEAEIGELFFARVVVSGHSDHADISNSTAPAYGVRDGTETGLSSPDVTPYYAQYNAIKVLTAYSEPARTVDNSTIDVPSTYSRTLDGKTRDYILFDKENATYVYLEAIFAGSLPTPDGGSGSFSIELSIVVEYGGGQYHDSIITLTDGIPLLPVDAVVEEAKYYAPLMPPRVFAPVFCKQGAFKYVAYSELADTAPDGFKPTQTAPVFLMSLPLHLRAPNSINPVPPNSFAFSPVNFYSFVGAFGGMSVASAVNAAFNGKIFYKHFADDAFTDWVVDKSVQFDPHYSEIYRT